MNTNGLARLYDRLTPRERLPLIVAASTRGDETERDRLIRSAPCSLYQLPDHYGLSDAVQTLVLYHLIEALNLAALYWRVSGMLVEGEQFLGTKGRAQEARLSELTRMFAYLLTVNQDAWRRIAAELQIDADQGAALPTLRCRPGRSARFQG